MKLYINVLLFVVLLEFPYFHICEAIEFRNDCPKQADKTILKLAFVLDRTDSFTPVRSILYVTAFKLFDEVISLYPDTEVAITEFFDYPKKDGPDLGDDEKKPHNLAHGCFGRRAEFLPIPNKKNLYRSTFRELERPVNNGGKEDSLHGLAETAVNKGMHWERNTEGKTVKKVAILMTDRGYGNISNPGSKNDYVGLGDESEWCNITKPATIPQVGEILKKRDIAVIGLLPFGTFEPDVLQTYEEYFQQMPGVPFCGRTFNIATESNTETIISSIMSCLKLVC